MCSVPMFHSTNTVALLPPRHAEGSRPGGGKPSLQEPKQNLARGRSERGVTVESS